MFPQDRQPIVNETTEMTQNGKEHENKNRVEYTITLLGGGIFFALRKKFKFLIHVHHSCEKRFFGDARGSCDPFADRPLESLQQ